MSLASFRQFVRSCQVVVAQQMIHILAIACATCPLRCTAAVLHVPTSHGPTLRTWSVTDGEKPPSPYLDLLGEACGTTARSCLLLESVKFVVGKIRLGCLGALMLCRPRQESSVAGVCKLSFPFLSFPSPAYETFVRYASGPRQ